MNPKICLSIGNLTFSEILVHLKNVALAEIRIDLMQLTDNELATVFNQHKNLIATYRTTTDFEGMVATLTKAINFGCAYIDIDIETPEKYRCKLIETARKHRCRVILSYHNFSETPDTVQLNEIVRNLFGNGAEIAKLACMANSESDCARVLQLYTNHRNLVAFAMGDIGKNTRIQSVELGAPFTYASIKGKETAPGQISLADMEMLLLKL